MRTDDHNNPTAFTTDIAVRAGLDLGVDYTRGSPFAAGETTLFTARLLGDPIAITIRVIDAIGFYTKSGHQRWVYIAMPRFIWDALNFEQKRDVIGFMYRHEGGNALLALFPNYGKA